MALTVLDKLEPKNPTALPKIIDKEYIDWKGQEPGCGAGSFYMVQSNTTEPASLYGVVTASKTGFGLVDGVIVSVLLKYPIGTSSKLNINETGDIPIAMRSGATVKGRFIKGDTLTFMYDSNYNVWRLISYDTFSESESEYAVCNTETSKNEKEVRIPNYTISEGNILMIKFKYAVNSEATATYLKINKGDGSYTASMQIKYQGKATDIPITEESTATFAIIDNSGSYYLDLQGVNDVGENTRVVIQDSLNYDEADDDAVPTCNAVKKMIDDRRKEGEVRDAYESDGVTGKVFEITNGISSTLIDWRTNMANLNIFLTEDCKNEVIIYYKGGYGSLMVDDSPYIGEIPIVESGKEYVMSIQDGIKVAGELKNT